jgi:excisionase family DNA binding protein
MIEQRYLSVHEAALYLGVSEGGIRKWIRCGTIPYSRFNGSIRFDRFELDKWGKR